MAVLEISARQFREKQKSFFEIADTGRKIVINRGKKQSYILAPFIQDDFIVTPELLAKLDDIRQQVRNGEYTECNTWEESKQFLDSL